MSTYGRVSACAMPQYALTDRLRICGLSPYSDKEALFGKSQRVTHG
jgi:hypothetical protein